VEHAGAPAAESGPLTIPTLLAPISQKERIRSIDVLRGVALLGILVMNIISFGLPNAAYSDPTIAGGATGASLWVWFLSQVFVEGKMRTVFSMLFGAGVVLLTGRAEERGEAAQGADIYYRRTLWLIAFGLCHAYFLWSGDILYGYGVAGLLLYPFRHRSPRFLMVAGLILLAVLLPKNILEGRHLATLRADARRAEAAVAARRPLSDDLRDARIEWRQTLKEQKPSPAQVAKEVADHRAGYWTLFQRRVEGVAEGQSSGFYRFGFFDVAGMMLLGMGLLKLGVFSAQRSRRFYVALALAGYGVGIPLNAFIAHRDLAHGFDPVQLWYDFSGYDLGRLTIALGHVAVVMLVCRAGVLRRLTARLAAVGQTALSNYLGTTVVCVLIFNGFGLGLYGRLQRDQLMYVMLAIWTVQLLLSPLWLRHFRFGPMEWLWRSLSHGRGQPMRRAEPAPLVPAAGPAAATDAVR
jgi:uncharacterized protein